MNARKTIRSAACALAVVLSCSGVAVGSGQQQPLHRMSTRSSELSATGYTGQGVTVAVIDTGVANVPALDGAVIAQKNLSAASDDGDQYGHGTFVAGIVHQIAPDARIVSVKLSGADGSVDVTQVLAALQWVALNRDRYSIDVVNLSFGNDSHQSWRTSPLNYAVQQVWDEGMTVVVSAGNLGGAAGTVTKPADDPVVISVGASDEHDTVAWSDDDIPTFVSRGPTQDGLAKPDLVAPGASIVSYRAPGSTIDTSYPEARVGEDGFRGSGTSFAAPIVTGLAAQLLSADPSLTPDEIKYALLQSAHPIAGDPAAAGAGTADVAGALAVAHQGRANVGVGRSSGTGTLQGARGSAVVEVVGSGGGLLSGLLNTLLPSDGLLTGWLTGQLDTFDQGEFLTDERWSASRWGASRWGYTQWGASRWGASRWGASRWGAAHWWASRWG